MVAISNYYVTLIFLGVACVVSVLSVTFLANYDQYLF